MMSQKNREPGWYWVLFNRSWLEAQWDGERFIVHVAESDLSEIDERRIVREEPTE